MQNFGLFWPLGLFCRKFTHFLAYLFKASIVRWRTKIDKYQVCARDDASVWHKNTPFPNLRLRCFQKTHLSSEGKTSKYIWTIRCADIEVATFCNQDFAENLRCWCLMVVRSLVVMRMSFKGRTAIGRVCSSWTHLSEEKTLKPKHNAYVMRLQQLRKGISSLCEKH